MREFKFRAWHKTGIVSNHNGVESPVNLMKRDFQWMMYNDGLNYTSKDGWGDKSDLSKFTIMQFTGMHDRNGKEIYESDFVKFIFVDEDSCMGKTYEEIYIVEWNERLLQFEFCELEYHVGKRQKHTLWSMDHMQYEIEVIGNIYENPELLK